MVYILLCTNGQYYVGSTTNMDIRIKEKCVVDPSQFGGAKFTKARLPIELVYTEEYNFEHEARIRERQLHKWSHAKKRH